MFLLKTIMILFFTLSFSYASSTFVDLGLIKIGYMYNNIFTTKKQSVIGEKIWKKEMTERGFDVDLIKIEKEEEALDLYERKVIYALVGDGFLYYKYKDKIDDLTSHKWILSKTDKKFNQYYLIKNKNSKFSLKKASDFVNKKILYKDQMAKIWFEYLLLKKSIKSSPILKKMQKIKKDKNLIFSSFFNESDISLISKDLYDSMLSLNPQIKEKIEIVEKSEAIFFNAMGITRKDLPKYTEADLTKMTSAMNEKDTDLKILSFVKIQRIYNLKKGDLDKTDKFFQEYYKLKNKASF